LCPTVLTYVYHTAWCHIPAGQTCHCSQKLRSQPQADGDTFWLVHRHHDGQTAHTHDNYISEFIISHQSDFGWDFKDLLSVIYNEIWGSQGGDHDVARHLGPAMKAGRYVASSERNLPPPITLMMEAAGTLKCWCISARLHGATTENVFGVRSVWWAKDEQQLSHFYPR